MIAVGSTLLEIESSDGDDGPEEKQQHVTEEPEQEEPEVIEEVQKPQPKPAPEPAPVAAPDPVGKLSLIHISEPTRPY